MSWLGSSTGSSVVRRMVTEGVVDAAAAAAGAATGTVAATGGASRGAAPPTIRPFFPSFASSCSRRDATGVASDSRLCAGAVVAASPTASCFSASRITQGA